MKNELQISDVAALFDVPESTLRYWEKKGLIHFERMPENNYRCASLVTVRNLCDITFYRKLSVSINELKQLMHSDYHDIEEVLLKNKDLLTEKIESLRETIRCIDVKLGQIDILKELIKTPMEFVTTALPAVRPFELLENSDLQNLVHFEKNLIIMIQYQRQDSYRYGVFVPDDYPLDGLIRYRDAEPKLYLKVLLKTSYDKIEENNLSYYYDYLFSHGYTPGLAMGKVLVSSFDGEPHNYYETWIEVKR